MSDLDQIAASVAALAETVNTRLSAAEARAERAEQLAGEVIIPAASRRAGIQSQRFASVDAGGRPVAPGGGSASASMEHGTVALVAQAERTAFGEFLKGDTDALAGMAGGGDSEFVAAEYGMSVQSDPGGGYTVAPQMSSQIRAKQWAVSPIGRLARHIDLDTGDAFEEPVDAADIGAEWVNETEDRPELDPATLKLLRVPLNEIYTNQPITQKLLDLSSYNLGAWLEDKISGKFARKAGNAFIWGTGSPGGQPLGILRSERSTDPDGTRDFFTLQYKNTASPTAITTDELIEFVYMLRAPYRGNARWLMNTKTAGYIRKLRDGDDNLIWANSLADGQPDRLLGFPVELDEEMPDVGSGTTPIAFGDFQQGYIVVERPGVKVLLDPYTKKPWVLFYAYHRVGGQVQNGEAIKLLSMLPS